MHHKLKPVSIVAALALVLAACGGGSSASPSAQGSQAASAPASVAPEAITIIHGTTDQPISYDPAGSYDLPSWNVIYNVMGTLLTMEPGAEAPTPDLAESCQFDDPQTYTCTLRSGVKFTDGSDSTPTTSSSRFERNTAIADPNGASSLNANLEEVEVVDPMTVTFHLAAPDATWPFVLTTGGNAIVPSDAYPADQLMESTTMIGTGPYKMTDFTAGSVDHARGESGLLRRSRRPTAR